MNYKERIAELLQTPRVYWTALENENKVDGLVDLCKNYIKSTDHGVEVGCFSGVSSRVISLHCGLLHCVDPWSWGAVAQAEQMFDAMLPNYPNIVKVKLPSVQAAGQYEDHSLDFVYVDADHAYASVVEDITAWKNKVKQGGFIAGHDSYMPEVLQAVRDCLGEPDHFFTDTSWLVKL
jgi:hypothetical protein